MSLYRCFFLDATNHIIGPAEIIEADDDQGAIGRAQHICDENPACTNVDLWCGDRHVRRLDHVV
jgi:hypothetical protein